MQVWRNARDAGRQISLRHLSNPDRGGLYMRWVNVDKSNSRLATSKECVRANFVVQEVRRGFFPQKHKLLDGRTSMH